MDKIADLAVKYKDQPNAHLLSLRSIRPHPGMLPKGGKDPSDDPQAFEQKCKALAQETRWLDIFLVTVRVLLSFNLELVPVGNNTTSRRAAKFLEVAGKDMGYDQEEYWTFKRIIYDMCEPSSTLMCFRFTLYESPFTRLIIHNPSFWAIDPAAIFVKSATGSGWEHSPMNIASPLINRLSKLQYRGKQSLEDFKWSNFAPVEHEGRTYQITGLNQNFF